MITYREIMSLYDTYREIMSSHYTMWADKIMSLNNSQIERANKKNSLWETIKEREH